MLGHLTDLGGWDRGELLLANLPHPGAVLRPWESRVLRRTA